MPLLAPVIKTPTLAVVAAALPPEGEQFAPWDGPAARMNTLRSPPSAPTNRHQLFGRSARAFAISASITGGSIACVPTLSDAVTNLPSMIMSGTDCTL